MKRMLWTIALVAMTTPALADDHGDEDGAPDMVDVVPCETDADCEDYKMICVEGYCESEGSVEPWTPECLADTDCADSEQCVWNECHATGTYCQADADCGEYMSCRIDGGGMSSGASQGSFGGMPVDPADGEDSGEDSGAPMPDPVSCESDEDCWEGDICVEGICTWQDEETETWGTCMIDPDQVPTDATCQAVCEAVGSCQEVEEEPTVISVDEAMSEESDSEDSDDQEMPDSGEMPMVPVQLCEEDADCDNDGNVCVDGYCEGDMDEHHEEHHHHGPSHEEQLAFCTAICSYTVVMEAGVDELGTLAQCLTENANADDVCAAMDACEEAGEAWGQAVEAADLEGGIGLGSGLGGGSGEALNTQDDGDTTRGRANAEQANDAPRADDGGGCESTQAPVIPWLVAMTLLVAGLLRRRQVV